MNGERTRCEVCHALPQTAPAHLPTPCPPISCRHSSRDGSRYFGTPGIGRFLEGGQIRIGVADPDSGGADAGKVSKIEQRSDVYISSLRSYIEAAGGKLKIIAEFPEGEVAITNFSDV